MASFFIRAASGQYELRTPAQLLKLLTTMARNKLNSQARKQYAQRRDTRRVSSGAQNEGQFVDAGESPSVVVAAQDLLGEVHRRLSAEERRILELRNQGYDWAAVAAELGGGAEALRRKLSRALDRVTEQLGLDDAL
jgi:DNA-directed RNA polymerase specialized sigma24 family protein